MKRQFLLFLLLIGSSFGFSQTFEFAPIGAKWYFHVVPYICPNPNVECDYIEVVESIKDTIVDGLMCRKLSDNLIFHQNTGDSVYLFDEGINKFGLLYAFDDIGNYYSDYCEDTLNRIDGGTIDVNGSIRDRHNYYALNDGNPNRCFFNNTIVVRGIGSLTGKFRPLPELADGTKYYLQCYEDPSIGQYTFNDEGCGLLEITDKQHYQCSISPSIFESNITLEIDQNSLLKSITLSLFDINGKKVYHENAESSSIDLSHLDSGIYLVVFTLSSGERVKTQKIIKR